MPEIPEMEHYKVLLSKTVLHKTIQTIAVQRERSINVNPQLLKSELSGTTIDLISRRAKFLIFSISNEKFLIAHMMLDGRLFFGSSGQTEGLPGKAHVILTFHDGTSLYFCDLRLGYLYYVNREELNAILEELGIEPLSSEFALESMKQVYQGKKGAIKPILMDQKLVCGIGNAYANEILFNSRILPERKYNSLQEAEIKGLCEAIPNTLKEGIRNGGYIEEPYSAEDRVSGGQNEHFRIYDRGGKPCLVCGSPIQETKLNGRWTYFCPVCQK